MAGLVEGDDGQRPVELRSPGSVVRTLGIGGDSIINLFLLALGILLVWVNWGSVSGRLDDPSSNTVGRRAYSWSGFLGGLVAIVTRARGSVRLAVQLGIRTLVSLPSELAARTVPSQPSCSDSGAVGFEGSGFCR